MSMLVAFTSAVMVSVPAEPLSAPVSLSVSQAESANLGLSFCESDPRVAWALPAFTTVEPNVRGAEQGQDPMTAARDRGQGRWSAQDFRAAVDAVRAFARRDFGWDGGVAPPPSALATALACRVIEAAETSHVASLDVAPDVDGGVGVFLYDRIVRPGKPSARTVGFLISNEGGIAGYFEDHATSRVDYFDVVVDDLAVAVARSSRFLAGS